jgi:hypothetical protein
MKRTALIVAAALCLWLPETARAEYDTGGGFGSGGGEKGWLLNGSTLGEGRTAIHGELGWPGLHLGLLRGLSDQLDVGGLFDFNFGFEGVTSFPVTPGLRFGGILRLTLMDTPKLNLGLRVSPALALYFYSNVFFGLVFPVEVVAGLPITHQLSLHFGMGLPMNIFLAPNASFILSFLPGVGVEYKLDHALSVTFDTKFGAAVEFGAGTGFQFRAAFGIGYRL